MATGFDPSMRRQTPLAGQLIQRIHDQGPLSVLDYVEGCLSDPTHGYYTTQTAIGSDGDFVTAPEISQVFGEMVGVWCASTWQQMERPPTLDLVELGPGRGTLMADILRTLAKVPELAAAIRVHLVEISPNLSRLQHDAVAGFVPKLSHWRTLDEFRLATNQDHTATIVVANEYLDALGVEQWIAKPMPTPGQLAWHQRLVGIDDAGLLQFETADTPDDDALLHLPSDVAAAPNEIFEAAPAFASTVVPGMAALAERAPLAGLFIDYGHTQSATGETLQAVRNHAYEHPLTSPGEADLTAQVDFAALARLAKRAGLAADGPLTQAEFLGRLGIVERTSRLMSANPDKAAMIEAGTMRLLAPNGMGSRFKAIALRSPSLASLPCFQLQ